MSLILNNLQEIDFIVVTVHKGGSKVHSVPHSKIDSALGYKGQLKRSLFSVVKRVNVIDILVVERTTVINERVVG